MHHCHCGLWCCGWHCGAAKSRSTNDCLFLSLPSRLLSETQRQMHDLSSYSTTNEEGGHMCGIPCWPLTSHIPIVVQWTKPSQHVITFRMCSRGGGSSRDLGSLCMNSTGISVEPMKLQKCWLSCEQYNCSIYSGWQIGKNIQEVILAAIVDARR